MGSMGLLKVYKAHEAQQSVSVGISNKNVSHYSWAPYSGRVSFAATATAQNVELADSSMQNSSHISRKESSDTKKTTLRPRGLDRTRAKIRGLKRLQIDMTLQCGIFWQRYYKSGSKSKRFRACRVCLCGSS